MEGDVLRFKCMHEQLIRADVAQGALLTLLPDPVVPFADSRFVQDQEFALAPPRLGAGVVACKMGGSVVLLDWVTSGRRARGEAWSMSRYESVGAPS